jgi:hypothetical protein
VQETEVMEVTEVTEMDVLEVTEVLEWSGGSPDKLAFLTRFFQALFISFPLELHVCTLFFFFTFFFFFGFLPFLHF